mmetsp:Transcript_8235/g.12657  ORF Transcript_8235/g.12657 Transcript_8235/m.12657 type:complete len:394 (+) Transcript_8235:208-1389(+)
MSSEQELQNCDIRVALKGDRYRDKIDDDESTQKVINGTSDILVPLSNPNSPSVSRSLGITKFCFAAVTAFAALIAIYPEDVDVNMLNKRRTTEIQLKPSILENLASLEDPTSEFETAVFWHIPKAGGTAIENLYAICSDLVVANEIGCRAASRDCEHEDFLEVFLPFKRSPLRVVNVDTTNPDGLVRAGNLGLAESNLAKIVFTSWLEDASESLFDSVNKGRVFTLMRHPVDRAVSEFYYLQDADWEPTYDPKSKGMTIEEYVEHGHIERNWMVSGLVKNFQGEILQADLEEAKQLLREKVLIGLLSNMEESIYRFDRYFGFHNIERNKECFDNIIHDKGSKTNRHEHPKLEPGSSEWKLLAKVNTFDVQLYEYAVELFEEQKSLFNDAEEGG